MSETQQNDVVKIFATLDARRQRWMAQVWLKDQQIGGEVGNTANEAMVNAVEWLEKSRYKEMTRKVEWRRA